MSLERFILNTQFSEKQAPVGFQTEQSSDTTKLFTCQTENLFKAKTVLNSAQVSAGKLQGEQLGIGHLKFQAHQFSRKPS
jgi:hypothetical protein